MGLMLLSLFSAVVAGCVLWLIVGDKLPLNSEEKLPAINNIAFYTVGLLVPIYVIYFALGL
ncbi:MAG: hypothetical protein ACI9UN_004024 [Granulosicoccus sp.]|jgi:hypothetical protein